MIAEFWRRVVIPNRWGYFIVTVACVGYVLTFWFTSPRWYKAEALLAFKNRKISEQLNVSRLASNPLPIILDEAPVEQAYELSNIIYSNNMVDRVVGDRFDEIYGSGEYDSLEDYYFKFLGNLSYEYDGEQNVIRLAYTYKDPELAADFCNQFAYGLEDFMIEIVESSHMSPKLRNLLAGAQAEADAAEAELFRISDLYEIPNLIESPKEWVNAYATALERSYSTEAKMRAALAILRQIRENRNRVNLLADQSTPPDTNIARDLVLAGMRFRLALINAAIGISEEGLTPTNPTRQRFEAEAAFLEDSLSELYLTGLDIESRTYLMQLQEMIVRNYLYEVRAEAMYSRLESLPRLEAEIRPVVRSANVANATANTLDRIISLIEIGEEYGVHPIMMIDTAITPERPVITIWKNLGYLLPTMLFMTTLWFALTVKYLDDTKKSVVPDKAAEAGK